MNYKDRLELERRIEISRETPQSNCIGLALYLARLKEEDGIDERYELPELELNAKKVQIPGDDQIILIEFLSSWNGESLINIEHAAYLFTDERGKLMVCDRTFLHKPIITLFPSSDIKYFTKIDPKWMGPLVTERRITYYQITR